MSQSFSQFLIETKTSKNDALLVLQKIIDMVDDGYVEQESGKITINVGKLIKDKQYYDLSVVIMNGSSHSVKLAQKKDGSYAIVIETTRLPSRSKIDTFLSNKSTVSKFITQFQRYKKEFHEVDEDREPKTSYEKKKKFKSRSTFETKFKELSELIKDKLNEYNSAKENLEREIKNSGTPGRTEVLKLSLESLKKELLGSNSKEFVSKMLKLADKDFVDHLDKELKNKLTNRLSNYYEHQIA